MGTFFFNSYLELHVLLVAPANRPFLEALVIHLFLGALVFHELGRQALQQAASAGMQTEPSFLQ